MHHFKKTWFNVAIFGFNDTRVMYWPFGEDSGLSVINCELATFSLNETLRRRQLASVR